MAEGVVAKPERSRNTEPTCSRHSWVPGSDLPREAQALHGPVIQLGSPRAGGGNMEVGREGSAPHSSWKDAGPGVPTPNCPRGSPAPPPSTAPGCLLAHTEAPLPSEAFGPGRPAWDAGPGSGPGPSGPCALQLSACLQGRQSRPLYSAPLASWPSCSALLPGARSGLEVSSLQTWL